MRSAPPAVELVAGLCDRKRNSQALQCSAMHYHTQQYLTAKDDPKLTRPRNTTQYTVALRKYPSTQDHLRDQKNHIPNADIAYDQCLLGILDDFNHPRYPFLVKSSIRASSPKSSACNPGTQGWKRRRSYISRDQQSLTQPSRSYLLVSLTSLK
jgi:hypothetical protein